MRKWLYLILFVPLFLLPRHLVFAFSQYEENEKIVNEIYLYLENNEIDTLNASQIAQLENIIYQCPSAGGYAVFSARALYSLFVNNNVYYDDTEVCNQQGISWRSATNSLANAISVYPNPSNDILTIEYPDIYVGAKISLCDLLGRQILTEILPQQKSLNLNVSKLIEGTYLLKIEGPKGVYKKVSIY